MSAGKVGWTPEKEAMLGKVTDLFLARQWGVTNACVASRRKKLGIEPCCVDRSRALNPWTPEHIALLGTMSDAEVARLTGHSESAVTQRRHRSGVPAFKRLAPKFEFMSWDKSLTLSASSFYAVLSARHLHCFQRALSHSDLARMSQYDASQIEKWFSPNGELEPLSVPARHHLWLLASTW